MLEDLKEFVHLFYFGLVALESNYTYRWAALALFIGGFIAFLIHLKNAHKHREDWRKLP